MKLHLIKQKLHITWMKGTMDGPNCAAKLIRLLKRIYLPFIETNLQINPNLLI